MFGLVKRKENLDDKYELTKSVKLVDVKGYLQEEWKIIEDEFGGYL